MWKGLNVHLRDSPYTIATYMIRHAHMCVVAVIISIWTVNRSKFCYSALTLIDKNLVWYPHQHIPSQTHGTTRDIHLGCSAPEYNYVYPENSWSSVQSKQCTFGTSSATLNVETIHCDHSYLIPELWCCRILDVHIVNDVVDASSRHIQNLLFTL